MTLGRLEVHTVNAKIEFSTRKTIIDVNTTQPSFSISRTPEELDIQNIPPKLQIDSSACQAEEGDMTVSQLIAQNAQDGIQSIKDLASQFTQDGAYIMQNFHDDKNVLADLANSKAVPAPKQSVFKFIPSQPPIVSFTDPIFNIDVQPSAMTLNWNVNSMAQGKVTQTGGVDITMTQYPSVEINYIPPQTLDTTA